MVNKKCFHLVGESYLDGAKNIERRVFTLLEAQNQFKNFCKANWKKYGKIYMKETFRYTFKYCPLCGLKYKNLRKMIRNY